MSKKEETKSAAVIGAAVAAESKAKTAHPLKPVKLPVQVLNGALVPQWQTAVDAEHYFANHGQNLTFVAIRNGGDKAVTAVFQRTDGEEPRLVNVKAGEEVWVGPFPVPQFNTVPLNEVYFTLTAADNISLSVVRLGI